MGEDCKHGWYSQMVSFMKEPLAWKEAGRVDGVRG